MALPSPIQPVVQQSISPPTSPLMSAPSTLTSHFVQALHDYLPSSSTTDESVSCLFFKKGTIIEVFNRDDSGWWDGQCGNVRGWFPSNYVGRIGELKRQSADFEDDNSNEELELWHQKMNQLSTVSPKDDNTRLSTIQSQVEMAKALLDQDRRRSDITAEEPHNPMQELVERVESLVDACSHQQTNIQLNVFQVVSSVRSILTEANIVNKESHILRMYPELARQRKIVLSALSRLVLKGKVLQQQQQTEQQQSEHDQQDQVSYFADQLLSEMEMFERLLVAIPRQSASSCTDSDFTTRPSSMFHDTPRSSISSIGHSSIISSGSTSLRHIVSEARMNSTYSLNKPVPTDTEHILQNVLDHQTNIDELMASLTITLERYLTSRHRATDMLEITRKAVEAVRTFLVIVEHVCSNLGDLDYNRRLSMIPEDPRLVSLVLSKESVYSAITNLVTAVRALTGPPQEDDEQDYTYLPVCCENVVQTTNECAACLRACLHAEEMEEEAAKNILIRQQTQHLDGDATNQSPHTLNDLGRKAVSLQAIQQYRDEKDTNETEIEELLIAAPAPNANEAKSCSDKELPAIDESVAAPTKSLPEKPRVRAASVNNIQLLKQQLPPLPPKHIKPSVSAAFPLPPSSVGNNESPEPLKSRRHRGLSVSSLRPSLSKSKSERIASTESLPETLRIQKLPSWMSLGSSSDKNEAPQPEHSVSLSIPVAPKEPEYDFLKPYTFSEDEMTFNAEGEVTGSTVEALVRKLTLHEKSPDLIFTRAFFYNFRLFTNASEFVRLLTKRFSLTPPKDLLDDQLSVWSSRVLIPVRLRVYNVIKTWLETYFNFEQDAIIEKPLMEFATTAMNEAMPGPAKRMVELIKRTFASKGQNCAGRKHSYNEARIAMQRSHTSISHMSTSLSSANGSGIFSNLTLFDDHHNNADDKYPPSILGKSLRNTLRKASSQSSINGIHFNDIDPVELARQITIMENNLFCCIQPNEMIGQEFKKKVGTSQAIHVKAMIQTSTQITSWISDTILHETDAKKRAQVLKYWIKVGDACLQLNNYNTLMAIRSALGSTSINRLKKTWEYVSVKYKSMWEPIHRATDSQRNFAEYRQRLKTTVAPCLPFLGVYLTDMTFIDDGNPDRRNSPGGNSLVNFDKYIKITRILNEIDQFQVSYKLLEVEEIQSFLKKTLSTVEQDDQVFYARSLQREPKEEDS